jgi:hypothetical protein
MIEFEISLPPCRYEYRLVGVYRIIFNDDKFYIGSSGNLKSRASQWASFFRNPHKEIKKYAIGSDLIERARQGGSAKMELIELCAENDLRDREAEYLLNFKDDVNMLSRPECSWKPVLQYKKDGVFIKKHVSITAAAKYNDTTVGRIQDVLHGLRQSHKEMVFVYEKDYDQRRKEIVKKRGKLNLPRKTKSLKIGQYSQDGSLIKIHETYNDAARSVNRVASTIKQALGRKQATSGGYKWGFIQT